LPREKYQYVIIIIRK